jgi:peptide/nickel transport system substrate-binding protein
MKPALSVAMTLAAAFSCLIPPPAHAADDCVVVAAAVSSGQKESMDPAEQLTVDDTMMVYAAYNRFVNLDDSLQVIPELAKSWDVSADGRAWTFHLEQGVKFHDGHEMTSADVIYSFRRLKDPNLGSGAAQLLSSIDSNDMRAIDKYTVQFSTKEPNAELPLMLANKFGLIVPDGARREDLRLHEDGTGPFVQEQFTPGGPTRILRRNPSYWRSTASAPLPAAACLKEIEIPEPIGAAAAVQSGQVDLLLSVDPSVLLTLKGDPKVKLLQTKTSSLLDIAMQVNAPPFNDNRVRQAMKLVVDRKQMVDTVLLGFGTPGNDNPIPPDWPDAYQHQVRARDVGKAKQLLAEAGYPSGLSVDLYTADAPAGMTKMAEAYQQMAADAGIKVNVIRTPAESYFDQIWLKKPFLTSYWALRPTAEGLTVAFSSKSDWNETNWRRPDFDKLLSEAKQEVDATKRVAMYQEAQKLLSDEGGAIVPMFIFRVAAIRANCGGFFPHPQDAIVNFEHLSCSR